MILHAMLSSENNLFFKFGIHTMTIHVYSNSFERKQTYYNLKKTYSFEFEAEWLTVINTLLMLF